MFSENMIAPCGLDCSLCSQAHKEDHPCQGCMGPDENKPEFCSTRCTIMLCSIRKTNHYRFCSQCTSYPCDFIQEREKRYQYQYVLKESPMNNLKVIAEDGMEIFLAKQKEKWTCKVCGGIVSVHTGICNQCKKEVRSEKRE